MSTLLAVKLNEIVVLGSDSRVTDDNRKHVLSDSQQKIHEISPGIFYGWNGFGKVALPQVEIAKSLAAADYPEDLYKFANRLDEYSRSLLEELVDAIRGIPAYEAQLTGSKPFHNYALIGMSNGVPGYLVREFLWVGGEIVTREYLAFKLSRGQNFSIFTAHYELDADMIEQVETWQHGAVAGVEKLIQRHRLRETLVGGPSQVATVDYSGARWVHKPPVTKKNMSAELLPANISGNSGNITGILSVGQIGSGVLPVGVIYAGTILVSQLGSGTLPVGVVYAGQINCSQLNAGMITASISMSALSITGGSLAITSGAVSMYVDASHFIEVHNSGNWYTQMTDTVFQAVGSFQAASLGSGGVTCTGPGGTSALYGLNGVTINGLSGQTSSVTYAKPGGGSGTITFTGGVITAYS